MSKSQNHYYTLDDLIEKGYRPSAIRRLLVSGHYRTELNFTLAGLDDASRSVERLLDFRRRLEESRSEDAEAASTRLVPLLLQSVDAFVDAMDDDLNVAEAWGALFTFVREANAELDRVGPRIDALQADAALEAVASMDRVFGVLSLADREADDVSEDLRRWVEDRLAERARARQDGDYERADAIRDELAKAGIDVEDTPSGSRWKLVGRG
jgi:cysteinyl-tRNA synthetase